MSLENVARFEELLRSDETLQAKLREAKETFDAEGADERAIFDALIAPLADEAGLPFTYEEGKSFMVDGIELSEEELDAVSGGGVWQESPSYTGTGL